MKYPLILLLFFVLPAIAFAQVGSDRIKQLRIYEDSLKSLGYKVVNKPEEQERKNANYTFIRTLVSALKINDSFHYGFDSVKSVTILNSPDSKFRLITWHVAEDGGTYRFYGAIQLNTAGPLKLYPLEDYSPLQKNPEDSVLDNRKWYGARYYKIIPVTAAANPYYVLLGWKGNSAKSTKKVIDVLSFKNGQPAFGLPVFTGNGKTRDRVVFEYTSQASMVLRQATESPDLIVFDHLSPSQPTLKGKYENYGPDMTYSGYRLKQGVWIFEDNLDLKNLGDARDNMPYVDPKKQAAIDAAAARASHQ
ncbi:hypothetical protein ACFGVR_16660 [Mucilaginibacter sp. AW1-3]